MIVEWLLTVAINVLDWLVSLVPDFGLTLAAPDFSTVWSDVGSMVASLNGWVPVIAAGAVLALLLTVQVASSAWGLLVWVYHQFWGSD